MDADTVCALVVTYNRQALLRECLDALLAQTRPVDGILVVNNSTDDTAAMLAERYPQVTVLNTGENLGSSGGFHTGLTWAVEQGSAERYWLMDDDTEPTPTALQDLLDALPRTGSLPAPVILASKVLWTDGEVHRMNWPFPRWEPRGFAISACESELLPLRACTWVSMLVHRRAIEEHGAPNRHWFMWGDDIEWTARVLKRDVGYLVPQSVVYHKTKGNHNSTQSSDERFYFDVRNKLFMLRGDVWTPEERFWYAAMIVRTTLEYLAFNRFRPRNILPVVRGVRDGLLQEAYQSSSARSAAGHAQTAA